MLIFFPIFAKENLKYGILRYKNQEKKLKAKNKIMELSGNTTIYFSEFPDWDNRPDKGEHIYSDSRIFEFELEQGMFLFNVKARVSTDYKRYYAPETFEYPEEDDILNHRFEVETLKGQRIHKETDLSMPLNELELSQIQAYLQKHLTIE